MTAERERPAAAPLADCPRELLQEFAALDDGDERYWWSTKRVVLMTRVREFLSQPDIGVPREPTTEMVTNGCRQIGWDSNDEDERRELMLAWKVMYDASSSSAPSPAPAAVPTMDARMLAAARMEIDRLRGMIRVYDSGGFADADALAAKFAEQSDELQRLRKLEHYVWHLLDDSGENVTEKRIEIALPNADWEKVCELLGDEHPSAAPSERSNCSPPSRSNE